MKTKKEKILKVFVNILLVAFFLVALFTGLSSYSTPVSWKLFIVQSGSMSPTVGIGSVVIVAPKDEYKKDDVITYKTGVGVNMKAKDATITHRIIDIKRTDDDSPLYITKGDNNSNIDSDPVTLIQVVGKIILVIPFLGYILSFTKTQTGLILLIVIPATLIIYSEILNIKGEVKKLLKKKKEKLKDE